MAIQWIVFDLGGVVVKLNLQASVQAMMQAAQCTEAQASGVIIETQDLNKPELTPLEQFMSGNINVDEYYRRITQKYTIKINRQRFDAILLSLLAGENPETVELLARLNKKHRLACFSNTHAVHWDYMQANYSFFKYFQPAFASHLTNLIKPDLAVFSYMERQLNAKADQCIFIDDSIKNVEAANKAGWHGILFKDVAQLSLELGKHQIKTH